MLRTSLAALTCALAVLATSARGQTLSLLYLEEETTVDPATGVVATIVGMPPLVEAGCISVLRDWDTGAGGGSGTTLIRRGLFGRETSPPMSMTLTLSAPLPARRLAVIVGDMEAGVTTLAVVGAGVDAAGPGDFLLATSLIPEDLGYAWSPDGGAGGAGGTGALTVTGPLTTTSRNGIALLQGATDRLVSSLTVEWTTAQGDWVNFAFGLISDPAAPWLCTADVNEDDTVDVFDLLDYLDLWFTQARCAELTGDVPEAVDVFDLLDYLDAWFAGC